MTLVDGVSASIHEARVTGNASGPVKLNMNACARGGSRNHAATISAPFVTSAVGISHGGRTTRRYSLTTARRSPGTASISTSSPSRHGDANGRRRSPLCGSARRARPLGRKPRSARCAMKPSRAQAALFAEQRLAGDGLQLSGVAGPATPSPLSDGVQRGEDQMPGSHLRFVRTLDFGVLDGLGARAAAEIRAAEDALIAFTEAQQKRDACTSRRRSRSRRSTTSKIAAKYNQQDRLGGAVSCSCLVRSRHKEARIMSKQPLTAGGPRARPPPLPPLFHRPIELASFAHITLSRAPRVRVAVRWRSWRGRRLLEHLVGPQRRGWWTRRRHRRRADSSPFRR